MNDVQIAQLRGWRLALFYVVTTIMLAWSYRPVFMTAERRDYLLDLEKAVDDHLAQPARARAAGIEMKER